MSAMHIFQIVVGLTAVSCFVISAWYQGVRIKFVPQDCWVGIYWKTNDVFSLKYGTWLCRKWTVYICIVPCFPIIWVSYTR